MRLSREEFCKEYYLSGDQFHGRELIDNDLLIRSSELPDGISLRCTRSLYLSYVKSIPEGCSLEAKYINLKSLKVLPNNFSIKSSGVLCYIILPTHKDSPEFYFGGLWDRKRHFKEFSHIKETPLKYLRSSDSLERALSKYFLKESL